MHAAVARLIHPDRRARRFLARLPLPVLLVAPAVIVLAIAAVTPELTRFGFALDLEIYRVYAVDLLAGLAPYRDVPIEYPPLAIVPMVTPLIGAPAGLDALGYLWRFAAIEATILVGVGWLVHRLSIGAAVGTPGGAREGPGGAREALGLWIVLARLSWVAILFRYDIWPGATTVGAALLADRRRPGLAGVALGVGTMLKLFPGALLPILAMLPSSGATAGACSGWPSAGSPWWRSCRVPPGSWPVRTRSTGFATRWTAGSRSRAWGPASCSG